MKSKLPVIISSALVLMSMSLAVVVARPAAAVNANPGTTSPASPPPATPAPTGGSNTPPASGSFKCTVLPQNICDMAKSSGSGSPNSSNSAVFALLQWAIAILTAGVGVAAVGAFIFAGIVYSSADGSAEQVKKAKGIIVNTVIGLVVFAAMALILVWIIPGGVF